MEHYLGMTIALMHPEIASDFSPRAIRSSCKLLEPPSMRSANPRPNQRVRALAASQRALHGGSGG